MLRKIKDYLTFRRESDSRPYDYADALKRLAEVCQKGTFYSVVLPGVFFDARKGLFCVQFECAMKEYTNGESRQKYFLSIRRDEKIWCDNLEKLLNYAIAYAETDGAFSKTPNGDLPEGITMRVKNIRRVPGSTFIPTVSQWRYQ